MKIGHDKMYPGVTGFELDMEDKCLVKQILECHLLLTVDRWQARSWNNDTYTQFCKDHGVNNLGQELHGNRFGDLERSCDIGVYSLEMWLEFVNTRTEIRNDLAIFLRDTQHLNDICHLLWLGHALLGINLTEPNLVHRQSSYTLSEDIGRTLQRSFRIQDFSGANKGSST